MPDNVLIIDDDRALGDSVARLLRSIGLDAQLFASISDFLSPIRQMAPLAWFSMSDC
jgi:FixJ family two-component response regulator